MGKASKALKEFIEGIKDSSLTGLSTNPGTICTDTNFRLDMQGMTKAKEHNLQVQANNGTSISTLKKVAPATVAGPVLVPSENPLSADYIHTRGYLSTDTFGSYRACLTISRI